MKKILKKYMIIVCSVLVILAGCKPHGATTEPDPLAETATYQSFRVSNNDYDLRYIATDPVSKNLIMLFGKIDKGINLISVYAKESTYTIEVNESNFYPIKYSINNDQVSLSISILKVDKAKNTIDFEAVNELTKQSTTEKNVSFTKEGIDSITELEQIHKTDLTSARVSSVVCFLISSVVKVTTAFGCSFETVSLAAKIASPLGTYSKLMNPKTYESFKQACSDAFEYKVTTECKEYNIDEAKIPKSCALIARKRLTPECARALADMLAKELGDLLNPSPPAQSTGDPHLVTFDNAAYDIQHVGELIATKATNDNFEIQVRHTEYNKSGVVSVNTGIAIQTGNDVVCVTVKPNKLYINKQAQDLTTLTTLSLKDGASITKSKEKNVDVLSVRTKNGDLIKIALQNTEYLDYFVYLSDNRKGKVIGLLGNYDGNRDNDIQIRNGDNILKNGSLSFDQLSLYADSWRVSQASSLFYYDAGKNTDSYTDKAFPRSRETLTADQKTKAESVCRAAGVTTEPFLSNCIVDVAITNNPDLVNSSLWGQQGNKFASTKPIPVVIEEIEVKRIVCASTSTFILKTDESLWVSGQNSDGTFGTGQPTTYTTNNKFVKIMDGVKDIAPGMDNHHMLFLKKDGLWAAGSNRFGETGNGTPGNEKVLTAVKIMTDAKAMAVGGSSSYVIKNDGTLWTFGLNNAGQLGDGTTVTRYTPVKVMSDVKSVSVGLDNVLVLKTDNSLWGFGDNYFGALGISKDLYKTVLSPRKLMDDVKTMCAGQRYSMVIKNSKELWVSGNNYAGQLGSGNYSDLSAFKKTMDNVADATASYEWSLILREDNTLWSTGRNLSGSLGLSTSTATYSTPVQSMSDVKYVVTGYGGTFIVKTDKSLWAVGGNFYGQLGFGTTSGSLSFSKVTVK